MNNSTNLNATKLSYYSWTYQVFGVILIPIALGGFLGSILCVWTICKGHHGQKTSSKLLFVNLCLATFLFCGLVCPFHIYGGIIQQRSFLASRPFSHDFCSFLALTHFVTLTASAYAHSVIAVNRLLAVVVTGRLHALAKSNWYTGSLIVLTWVIAVVIFTPPLLGGGGAYGFSADSMKCSFIAVFSSAYVIWYKVINSLAPFIIMVVCYSCIFWKVSVSKRRVPSAKLSDQMARESLFSPVLAQCWPRKGKN
ncbi:hypothetical protein BV898_04157 [Hypsibius exemplaris]|uniref:G-protein coupled receptors family 1 profile domain-containing protein n=1 Tax=Hypsibius exemplaris TaxID=2072580 RepID=A0A1W0X364_HYPEX|nr:hypothetical protein BV898_04157 [Hypsibius exemplaris]